MGASTVGIVTIFSKPDHSITTTATTRETLVIVGSVIATTTSTWLASQKKWVVNMSSSPLMEAQRSLLGRGTKFVVVLRHPPKGST